MATLGIYIYNETLDLWFLNDSQRPVWGPFHSAYEFPAGSENEAEKTREQISGGDVTFVMAVLH